MKDFFSPLLLMISSRILEGNRLNVLLLFLLSMQTDFLQIEKPGEVIQNDRDSKTQQKISPPLK